ncbi:MAG: hypothetical protein JXA33_12470 [Anaerolineae bacterium]|nr:hypothetical protein [Anaerolineae bacterium]
MSVDYVTLDLAPGGTWAALREICGRDEEEMLDTGTVTAIQLLDRLLVNVPGTHISPGSAAALTASDRDRLLAAVYQRTYGPRVESTLYCSGCGAPFDMEFSLQELLDKLRGEAQSVCVKRRPDNTYELPDGRRFRLLTGEDEYAVWHLSPEEAEKELMRRCVAKGDPAIEPDVLQKAMDEVAPVLDLEVDARCPECGALQSVHFDIQSYLLAALQAERSQLAREVHHLAIAYGWSLSDILSLTRSQRRTYMALIEAEILRSQRGYA